MTREEKKLLLRRKRAELSKLIRTAKRFARDKYNKHKSPYDSLFYEVSIVCKNAKIVSDYSVLLATKTDD